MHTYMQVVPLEESILWIVLLISVNIWKYVKEGGGVTLYAMTSWSARSSAWGWMTKSLWVSITGRAGTADIIVEVCYRHPEKED